MTALLQLVPIFAGVAAGHSLVRSGVATREHGRFLFVFVFYVCAPALIFAAFSDTELTRELLILPLAAAMTIVAGYAVGLLVNRLLALPPPRFAVFLMACMIVNTAFTLPFIEARLGQAGVTRLMAFDVGNSLLVFSWVYAIAVRHNPARQDRSLLWRKLLTSPPLYAVAAGLVVNLSGARLPEALRLIVEAFAAPTGFLITIGIGMLLVFERSEAKLSAWAIGTRLCTSLAIGLAFVALFDLTGVERAVLLTLSVAPVGFNTVTFASLEDLDLRLATNAASLSLIASLALVPIVLLVAT